MLPMVWLIRCHHLGDISHFEGGDGVDKKEIMMGLEKSLKDFSDMMRNDYKSCSKEPATHGDLHELAQQTFYVLDDIKKAIDKLL